jgi:hypothetical protein
MKRALEGDEAGQARIIPILLRPVDWEGAPFSHLQTLPKGKKPVTGRGWRNQDEAFANIARDIRKAVKELKEKQQQIKSNNIQVNPEETTHIYPL